MIRNLLHAPRAKAITLAVATALLTGCTTFSKDGGFNAVEDVARDKLGQSAKWIKTEDEAASIKAEVGQRLANPLSADDAVQIALWNNPGLQASYAELQLSEADLVAAGRLPGLRLSRLRVTHPAIGSKIEELIGFNLLALLTIPARVEAQQARFDQVKANAAAEMLRLAFDTRKAYYDAIAAEQSLKYMGNVRESAEAGAELARRMERAGNFSRLTRLREHSYYADAQSQFARAGTAAMTARERLTRLMGLAGEDIAFKLPERLPDLPKAPQDMPDAQAVAMRERLDVRAAKAEAAAMASTLGLTKVTRFVNSIDVAKARIRDGSEPVRRGWDIGIELPIFDFGASRNAQAEAMYMQSVSRVAETAVNAQSEVREAYHMYRSAYDQARHYGDEVVPIRKKISEETLLRYNGMLASVFELLSDAREQVMAVNNTIKAQRDFWVADADLRMAMTGKPTGIAALKSETQMESAKAGH